MRAYQHTIAKETRIDGIGLHTGLESTAVFKPAEVNSGIRFVRGDLKGAPTIRADIDQVVDISRGTTISLDGHKVRHVEHILAATMGLGIDNLLIELSAEEPPVMDGSAKHFVDRLMDAGLSAQSAPRQELVVDRTVSYSDPAQGIDMYVLPADTFRVTLMMDYPHISRLGTQYMSVYNLEEDFVQRIAPARTFCLFSEVKGLKEQGLAKGGNLSNAVVFVDRPIDPGEMEHLKELFGLTSDLFVGKDGILNDVELRYENEAVRHKVLDLIGDLALIGVPIKGHVVASRSGHAANVELVRRLKQVYGRRLQLRRELSTTGGIKFDSRAISTILPHRYPFLLVDRILEVEPGKRVKAIKNVTMNEEFFQGHFPGRPVMPAVLILESLAQAGAFLLLNTVPDPATKVVYFTAIDKARFRRVVTPGDQLVLDLELLRIRLGSCKIAGRASVDGELVAEVQIMAAIVDRED